MKLVFNPDDSYVHKALVVAFEKGLIDALQFDAHDPFGQETGIWEYSPLGKAPVLVMENGRVLYGGLAVCEYFDAHGHGPRLFPDGHERWDAYRLMMLGDGMFDAAAMIRV
ncbi:MAG: glutathione S-transferase N-terminal domain-containing protein [Alphaproteobacteria bacterium]|nr:glutathione S-transferase N-terminal domain-containing protein [Alphaproteobacteria bacterium]